MPRGGKRPGAGRKPGGTNRRTKERAEAYKLIAEEVRKVVGGENFFEGDAHALMVAVYKDQRLPLPLRVDAAKSAAPYEKPRLQAIEHSGNIGDKSQEDWLDELDQGEPKPAPSKPARKR